MKKLHLFFVAFFVITLTTNCLLFSYKNHKKFLLHEGAAIYIKPALTLQKTNREDESERNIESVGDNTLITMWQVNGLYKYQQRNSIYGRLKGDYGEGKTSRIDGKYRLQNWNVEASLGWTFQFLSNGMISPFLTTGYDSFMNKRVSDNIKYAFRQIKSYGFYGMIGADMRKAITKDLSFGVMVGIGTYINPHISFQVLEPLSGNPVGTLIKKKKFSGKHRPFFRIGTGFVYHYKSWQFGIDLQYDYRSFKAKAKYRVPINLDHTTHRYSAAIVIGLPL